MYPLAQRWASTTMVSDPWTDSSGVRAPSARQPSHTLNSIHPHRLIVRCIACEFAAQGKHHPKSRPAECLPEFDD